MNTISNVDMDSQKKTTMIFSGSKEAVAQFAADLLLLLGKDYAWITITARGSSEVCSVSVVTNSSLEDTVLIKAQTYSLLHINT